MAIEPSAEQLAEIGAGAGGPGDGPVVMLNLNRYRERAAYEGEPPDGAAAGVAGRDAYARYGVVAATVLTRLGGRVLWHARAGSTVIGDEGDRCDEVIAVWYPSRAAFLALVADPELLAAVPHRRAALERAVLICCEAGPDPAPAAP